MLDVEELEARVVEAIHRAGWARLTRIQEKSYRAILRRRNVLLIAPTGSGKTEAAVIPIFVATSVSKGLEKGVRVIYVTPLRALNRDIFRRIIGYAEGEGLSANVRHGDTPASARAKMLEHPPDVLITTPETLSILLTSRKFRSHLKAIEWVVVDEIHELLGNERGAHLTLSLEKLEEHAGRRFVRAGLSATVGEPDKAAKFLVGVDRDCAVITDDSVRGYKVSCHYVDGAFTELADNILERYLSGTDGRSTLLFTNTRDEAEYLGAILKSRAQEIPIEVHHGSLSRETREEAEQHLRTGEAGLVVCTSSLELGLDIGQVNLVGQLGSPRQATKLVQRIGRSRHRVGEDAVGFIVTNRLDEELEGIAIVRRAEKEALEKSRIHESALDVVAHHLVGLLLQIGSFELESALHLFKRAYPFRNLAVDDLKAAIQVLERQRIVGFDGIRVRRRGPATYKYYYENISTIPDVQQFDVIDSSTGKRVGRLDQMFVGEYGEQGKAFVLKGVSWKIVGIDDRKMEVHVEPVAGEISTIPYWVGELIPVDFHTAQEVGRLRRQLLKGIFDGVSERQLKRLKETVESLGFMPDDKHIVVEHMLGRSLLVIHLCYGTKVNQTLATILSTLISSKTGFLVEARSDPYRILLSSNGPLPPHLVKATLSEEFDIEHILTASVVGTHPLNWKTWYVAKRFGVIGREAKYDRRATRLIQERYRNTALYAEVLRELFLEKYDVEVAERLMQDIREGSVEVLVKSVADFSPLAKPMLEYASAFAALPLTVEKAVLDLVRERLENTRHRLVCLSCARWESIVKARDVREPIVCPLCHSRLITATYVSDEELRKTAERKKKMKQVTQEEDHKFRRAWKTSSLIQNFGRRAIIILSGFGVGVDTAARILRKNAGEEELYKTVYAAEKSYITTRGFWRD